jgi:hypothetical protein
MHINEVRVSDPHGPLTCWASVLQSIYEYTQSRYILRCDIAAQVVGIPCCDNTAHCTGPITELQIDRWYVSNGIKYRPALLTWASITNLIDEGYVRQIITQRHTYIIVGYHGALDSLYIFDPNSTPDMGRYTLKTISNIIDEALYVYAVPQKNT